MSQTATMSSPTRHWWSSNNRSFLSHMELSDNLHTVHVHGHRTAYVRHGDGPRLVLISGFPTDILTKIRGTYLERISHLRSRWLFAVGYHLLGRWAFRKYLGAVVCRRELITAAVVERAYRLRKDYGNSWPYWSSLQHISYWEEQFAPRLHAVRAPTLIVWGDQDRFFPLHAGEELQRALPNARWAVIQEAGHLPMWEKPEEVNRLIVEFLT